MTPRQLTKSEMAAPGSPLWRRQITASKIPAILGLSPWQSPYALWHEMAGNITPDPLKGDHLDWGHDAEDALVNWWLRKHPGWQAGKDEIAYHDPALPFPNQVTLDRRARTGRRFHIIEAKTSRDLDTWGKPGEPDSVPAHYTAQVITQMGISGIHEADVVVLGFGTPEIHHIPWNPEMFAGLVDITTDWWDSLQTGNPPDLDDTVATYDTVRGLHQGIDEGSEIQVEEIEAFNYLDAIADEKAAKSRAQREKTLMLKHMGNHHKAMLGATKIADRRPNAHGGISLYANTKANLTA